MLRVNVEKRKRSWLWVAIPISLVAHVVFFSASEEWAKQTPREPYGASKVRFTVKPPPPVEPPKPKEKPPEPEKPKPKPPKVVDLTKPKPKPTPPPEPMPNRETPPPETPPAEPPKAVFGVTADSLGQGNSGVAVRVGNTLAKDMEPEFTPPTEVKDLPPAPPPRPAPPKPVPNYELTKTPAFKNKIEPEYPPDEREKGIEGVVQLEVLIDDQGSVRKVRVLQAPTKALAKAAVAALRRSSFSPGFIDDRPVAVKVKIPYRFVLNS